MVEDKATRQAGYNKKYRESHREKVNTYNRSYREANRDQIKKYRDEYNRTHPEAQRKHRLKRYYGISLEDYNELVVEQESKCKICKRSQEELPELLSVDHDHETGRVRGLLCGPCNKALGMLQDSANLLQNAADYLAMYPKTERVEF